ncbi:MAG: hypothetical protein GAK45_00588 [Pseudomonas citronellolis]|nr:MAG: hypothetical protein GAK45_00588 [Pseudomonas citronellolis]
MTHTPKHFSTETKPRLRRWPLIALLVFGLPWLVPQNPVNPVQGASPRDWNPRSFWYEPWGVSGVHKGIDIFASAGTPAQAPVPGWVLYSGSLGIGGNVVLLLGPRWRLHYLAHLQSVDVSPLTPVWRGSEVGRVGSSGNAAGKPPHLHYAILSLLPRPWAASDETQGWKKMFFIDPGQFLQAR